VDLSLHKLAVTPSKYLKHVALFALPESLLKLLMNVNKPGELRESFARA
jgi:hypothetical protein